VTRINPEELGAPRGFSHGILAPRDGRMLFVAGQTASDNDGRVTAQDFVAQFELALTRSLVVVAAAGGRPEHIARMTVYVTDLAAYRRARPALGEVWQRHMGPHYPAMALVEVAGLVDAGATVEIEVTAVVPEP
jgi:enamine deaminase RidA (YjgF/YER057c/UK114 family)